MGLGRFRSLGVIAMLVLLASSCSADGQHSGASSSTGGQSVSTTGAGSSTTTTRVSASTPAPPSTTTTIAPPPTAAPAPPPTAPPDHLRMDGLSLDGPLPLRWGASLAEVERIAGARGEPICGFDSIADGAVVDAGGLYLYVFPDSGLTTYMATSGNWKTVDGVGIGTSFADVQARTPRMQVLDAWNMVLDGTTPSRMLFYGEGIVAGINVASGAMLEPESEIC